MSAIHHPCVGDLMYGADPTLAKRVGLDRQWLHAKGLGFTHPRTGEWVEFASEYPADLVHALEVVRTSTDNPAPALTTGATVTASGAVERLASLRNLDLRHSRTGMRHSGWYWGDEEWAHALSCASPRS